MAISLAPVSGIDLFTDAALLDPHRLWRELRDKGPVVYLSAHDVYAIPRHAIAVEVLDDWQRYSSAQGVFMNAPLNEQLGGRITLCLDPPAHSAVRELLSRPLKADAMRELRPSVVDAAEAIVDRLVGQGSFDAATELAEALPMTVVAGSWADQLYAAADRGEVPREQCPFLMLDYITASLDTTIYAIPTRSDCSPSIPISGIACVATSVGSRRPSTRRCGSRARCRTSPASRPGTMSSPESRCAPATG